MSLELISVAEISVNVRGIVLCCEIVCVYSSCECAVDGMSLTVKSTRMWNVIHKSGMSDEQQKQKKKTTTETIETEKAKM